MIFIILLVVTFAVLTTALFAPGPAKGIPIIFAVFLIIAAVFQLITIVPAGHVGVVDTFGHVSPDTLKSGLNMVNPFARVPKMSIQTQEVKEVMDVPSQEGLAINLEISALFHLDPEMAATVYKGIGTDYINVILIPNFRAVTRGVTAQYDAKALYTSERERLGNEILANLKGAVGPRGITIESTPLRKITLPEGLAGSITNKLMADQANQTMTFVLEKEKKEAERKTIEAGGIASFQRIVTQGISEQLLEWKGIEATEKLVNSPNTKVIVIGSSKTGLPLIFNAQETKP